MISSQLQAARSASRFQRVAPAARVILMSGYTEKLREPGSEHVPDAFLEKPFTAKALDHVVDAVLRKR